MPFCSSCGKAASPTARFCESCGTAIGQVASKPSPAKAKTSSSSSSFSRAAPVAAPAKKTSYSSPSPKPKAHLTPAVVPASKDKPKGAVSQYRPTTAKGPSTADTSYDMGGGVKKTYEQQPAWAHAEQHKNQNGQFKTGMFSQTGPKYK